MLAKHFRRRGFVVATQDEATFGLIPNVARGWARKGSRSVANMNYRNICINVLGARTRKAFVFSFCKKKSQRTFVEFLKLLLRRWSRVCLFTDNAPWHHGSKVNAFLKNHPKTFKLIYFPKYSPEVNPVEPCWKPARQAVANRLFHTLPAMQYHLKKTFSDVSLLPKMFKYLIN
jgi:transposase